MDGNKFISHGVDYPGVWDDDPSSMLKVNEDHIFRRLGIQEGKYVALMGCRLARIPKPRPTGSKEDVSSALRSHPRLTGSFSSVESRPRHYPARHRPTGPGEAGNVRC
jgi:hypothetical protein